MTTLAIETLLTPADAVRSWVLRAFGRWAAPWARDRDLRVAVMGVVVVATALASTVLAPLWMLALGPIVLGVPHIVADLRYLWVQPGYHRRRRVWLLVVPALAIGAFTGDVAWGFGAAMCALFAVPSTATRRALGVVVLLPLAAASIRWSGAADLLFAHLHNVLALALWWTFRPRRRSSAWVLIAFGVASVAIVGGVFDALVHDAIAAIGGPGRARPLTSYARNLAPVLSAEMGARVVLLFAFAQSVHYGVWLRLVPEDARPRPAPRPFRSSWRALVAEMGVPLLVVATLLALALAGWAALDLATARAGYLRFAIFHGHLELAAAALLFAGGRGPSGAR